MQYKIFGCKTNKYFTEKWMSHLEGKGGYFIASCVVTDKAKAKWVKHAIQILEELPEGEKLYLSGCGNIRNGVVDPAFFEVYDELLLYKDKIELLPEDPEDNYPNSEGKDGLDTPLRKGGTGGLLFHFGGATNSTNPIKDFLPFRPDLTEKARKLRSNMTGPEKMIWYNVLMNKNLEGYKFTRQKPILDYIVDFYCHELKLAIEIDGDSHIEQQDYDELRTKELAEVGVAVIRFTNEDCIKNTEGVYEKLIEHIRNYQEKPPFIPPFKGDKTAGQNPSSLQPSPLTKGSQTEQNPLLFPLPRGIRSFKSIGKKQVFTRRYMVVQNGCDNFCTFCLTVQARGRHKWRPMVEIVDEINEFVESGGKEVVFTGTNLGAWGADSSEDYKASRFVELVETVLERTKLERLRISSLGVEFCSDKLIHLFQNPRIIAYVHLSIQSGSSTILKSMNRHYDGAQLHEVLTKFRAIKRQDDVLLNIGADLIVGFPGETEADFDETLDIVRQFEITQLHAFAFSPHVDHYSVPAGSFPNQVPNHMSQAHLKRLIKAGEEVFENFLERNRGKEFKVLIEKIHQDGGWEGWTENYIKVDNTSFSLLEGQEIKRGKVVKGKLL